MSRRRRKVIVGLCLAGAALVVWLDHSPILHRASRRPPAKQAGTPDFEKYHARTFAVTRVVDGDTIDIDVPDGPYEHTRIRLLGVDAPETFLDNNDVMYFGHQATEFATETTLGKTVGVYLDTLENTRGKYGRLLAYVQLPDGRFLNEVLVDQGYAYADLRFHHSHYNRYKQLEAGSRTRKNGLWQAVRHEQLPEWLQRRRPTLLTGRQ
jgi:micrococcal nuclease